MFVSFKHRKKTSKNELWSHKNIKLQNMQIQYQRRLRMWDNLLGGGGGRSQIIRRKKVWPSINHSILSATNPTYQPKILKLPADIKKSSAIHWDENFGNFLEGRAITMFSNSRKFFAPLWEESPPLFPWDESPEECWRGKLSVILLMRVQFRSSTLSSTSFLPPHPHPLPLPPPGQRSSSLLSQPSLQS